MNEKEEIVCRDIIPHPPADLVGPSQHRSDRAHQKMNETIVQSVLFNQSQKKVPRQDRLNFSALRLHWNLDVR